MKKYRCEVHGDIENDTLQITLDEIEHTYCLRCLDAMLFKHLHFAVVELVEDDHED